MAVYVGRPPYFTNIEVAEICIYICICRRFTFVSQYSRYMQSVLYAVYKLYMVYVIILVTSKKCK